MTALRTIRLTKRYPTGVVGVNDLDLDVPPGDRLALLGPSGSGKSTLLRLVAGLETPDSGKVEIDGRRVDGVPPHLRGVGFLPQRPALYPHLTVRENLDVHLKYGAKAHAQPSMGVDLNIQHLLDRYPHQLSGGERQRVALARLAGRKLSLWLLDEPFAPLDPLFRSEFRHDLHLLLESSAATILLVTHDPIDALALGRRVGVLGDGRLVQLGSADELRRRPQTRFVALALGQFSFLDGKLIPAASGRLGGGDSRGPAFRADDGSVEVEVPGFVRQYLETQPTHNLALGIRPEDVLVGPPGTPLADASSLVVGSGWPVVSAEPVGSGWLLTLARGRSRVRMGWSAGSPPPVGDPVHWYTPAPRVEWFDAAGRRIPSDTA